MCGGKTDKKKYMESLVTALPLQSLFLSHTFKDDSPAEDSSFDQVAT